MAEWVFKIDTRKNALENGHAGLKKSKNFFRPWHFGSRGGPATLFGLALKVIVRRSTVDDVNHLRASGDPRGDGDDEDRGNHPETDDDGGKDHAERGIRRERPDRAERIEPPE